MSTAPQGLQQDLAFMRALAEGGVSRHQPQFGAAYLAAGLCYGAQCLFGWGQYMGWIQLSGPVSLAIHIGFTIVFLAILIVLLVRNRGNPPAGMASRAVGAAFSSVGLTNCVMIAVFGTVAARHHSMTIWLLYPIVVFALQGAAWLIAAQIQKRNWMCAVALGWMASAIALGLTIDGPFYVAICGVSLLGLMALPGAIMMRRPAQHD
ncbi:MAG TPA: hypothetical protein VK533_12385 [Sphingomonas sp.]|uniref:hypothetical protein n=1 Tax=Sphingomonas sp. TaxID=28214 RepID=UPI002C0E5A42|nr:hypothetical protein [Sphingomonas sp.]HMI20335.1 hypothetical protein [Sphingomonas sp.]